MDDCMYFKFQVKCYIPPTAPLETIMVEYKDGVWHGYKYGELAFTKEPRDMSDFWEKIDALEIWNWERFYERVRPVYTYMWELEMDNGNLKNMISMGLESYPPGVRIEESIAFQRFIEMLTDYIGYEDFFEMILLYED